MVPPLKKSKQREAILSCVKKHHDHPTADVIYQELRQSFPNISLGTVYRNLSLLADLGQIKKISGDNHTDHFDGMVTPHAHFSCQNCGCLLDFPYQPDFDLKESAAKHFEGIIKEHTLIFHGLCQDCMPKS